MTVRGTGTYGRRMALRALPDRATAVDAALVLLTLAVGIAEVLSGQVSGPRGAGVVTALLFALPLAVRRRHPWPVLVVVYGTLVLCGLTHVSTEAYLASVIGCVVALGTIAAREALVPSLVGAVAAYVVLLPTALTDSGGWIWGVFIVGATWVGGRMLHTRRVLVDELRATATELEAQRELAAEAAVAHERTRLARELHDVIAHSVSVMVVQAAAAERVVHQDPDAAARALATVEDTGREALGELRHLLGVLRPEGGAPRHELTPQPGLAALDRLVDQFRGTGVELTVSRDGDVRPLAPGLELAAYRILQEALTNVLRHGHARRADVQVGYAADRIALVVTDDGAGGPPVVTGTGNGIRGMSERAALYGGTLEAGPAPGGGFEVRAVLPVPVTS